MVMKTLGSSVAIAIWSLAIPVFGADAELEKLSNEAFSILNRACIECHGREKQEGGLRLDSRDAMMRGGAGGPAIDLGKTATSELLRRIVLPKDDDDVMPQRGNVLSASDIDKLTQWIDRGAPWSSHAANQPHWAYIVPKKVEPPGLDGHVFANPLDAFVAAGLRNAGMSFAEVEDLRTLCRRIYLDVIGLPPTVGAVEDFRSLAQQDLDAAVASLVDQLMGLPQYGEKWARPWLDAARYADSHGFQRDDLRDVWAYRDWIIRALNEDMPFDQFAIEQLAGDLLPNASQSQLIATGFNRCAPCNVEAGTDPEENRFNQIVDRVNTLGYVWLGTSLECAQCHDHKYDPFTRKEYYGLFAYFNQTTIEADRANPNVPGSIRFIGPYLTMKSTDESRANELADRIARAKRELDQATNRLAPNGTEPLSPGAPAGSIERRQLLRPVQFESVNGSTFKILDDGSVLLQEDPPDVDTYVMVVPLTQPNLVGLLIETLIDPSLPGKGPGRGDVKRPNFVLNSIEVNGLDSTGKIVRERIGLADAKADFSQSGFLANNAIDNDAKTGWAIAPQFFKDHWIAFRLVDAQAIDGIAKLQIRLVQNSGNARTIGRLRLSALVDDYAQAIPAPVVDNPQLARLRKELMELEEEQSKLQSSKTLVMEEVSAPRLSTMFARGDFRSPTDVVEPATPAVLHSPLSNAPRNRLGLAQWLVSKQNPLVARVVVNRMWAEIFGNGLVTTPEDFGLKGDAPSHAELLDWLAVEFMERDWSQKAVLRQILTSQTYRQSSRISQPALALDPDNRLLARGARFRLPAESVRDNALAISGLLSLKQFGPPIRPPQPEGLWTKVGGDKYDYQVSPGEDEFRRGIYVVLKRMSPYPSFITFDSTSRLACRVKRSRSNTPLQALTLLNDPVYVRAAQAFAGHVQNEFPTEDLDAQLRYAFQTATARLPSQREVSVLRQLFENELHSAISNSSPDNIRQAWYAVATTLLNLDETITRE